MSESSSTPPNSVPMQDASIDIWDKKYRLKDLDENPIDRTVDDTYARIAKTLSDMEDSPELREHWYARFLQAMRHGAIPAGRITSNAGAQEYKPSTSLINCTVSGTVGDSMDNIMVRAHEAALTLKSGCGIGYSFSTLRPRGGFVNGAGASTSGPLSFMDIFDSVCFTVASAGGRRGAQMATFDIGHPDVRDFIKAKREDGRFRQFNLSLLITDEFIEAVRNGAMWPLSFPIHNKELHRVNLDDDRQVIWRDWPIHENYTVREDGKVACRVYERVNAQRLWDLIMSSTYDFAEPGFILIDRVNEMNNNWWCENIQATNPCVTGDTRLHTQFGMVRIDQLCQDGSPLQVTVDNRAMGFEGLGVQTRPAVPAFMSDPAATVYRVTTKAGYEIKATDWHGLYTEKGRVQVKDLMVGDKLLIQSGKGQFGSQGSKDLGLLMGLIAGDGHFTGKRAIIALWGDDRVLADRVSAAIRGVLESHGETCGIAHTTTRDYGEVSPVAIDSRNQITLASHRLATVMASYGFNASSKLRVPEVIWQGTEACVKMYLSALFQADGTVQRCDANQSCSIRLSSSDRPFLRDIQDLLGNFGIFSSVLHRRASADRMMPDGKGGQKSYPCKANYELIIGSESRNTFMREIRFLLDEKNEKFDSWLIDRDRSVRPQNFSSEIESIERLPGMHRVFDTTQGDRNNLVFSSIVSSNCGEQPLPPHGSCLLGSINLTSFVRNPFTEKATFDWEQYEDVVRVFTRMLDNVVELNGLPLAQQRHEIFEKRRHGMGFLGLGSALTMMRIPYGSPESLEFTDRIAYRMAAAGWEEALDLAKEKGPAPIMLKEFEITPAMMRLRPEMADDGHRVGDRLPGRVLHAKYSRYMQRLAEANPALVDELANVGARFTHHSSIAPTGTISLSLANNASNGIEPSFAHAYSRNIIRPGRKTKEKVDVYSYELLAYRTLIDANATSNSLPDYFVSADQVTPKQHVDIQAAAQKWVDSSISKTANVPTDYPYEDFKDIYMYAHQQGLKGCTTFRFNPAAFQGVLVKESDLENTTYTFTLADGSTVSFKGNESVEYDGETHSAANLFDALKEGYYGKF